MQFLNHLHLEEKKWIETNEDGCGKYNNNSQIKIKNTISHVPTLQIWYRVS